jgi:glycosyltransferase involved in cell wall biosynthesis
MRILHFINALSAGGAEMFTAQLCTTLARTHEVGLLTYAGVLDSRGADIDASLRKAGVHVTHLDVRSSVQKGRLPLKVGAHISSFRPDVVNVHLDQSEVFAALARPFASPRPAMVRTLHNTIVVRASARWLAPLLRASYDWTIACGSAVATALANIAAPGRLSIIPNGIDTRRFRCQPPLASSGGPLRLVAVGSMSLRAGTLPKGQDVLLRSLQKSGLGERVELLLVGDGDQRSRLEAMAAELGLRNVRFAGLVHDIPAVLHGADAVVLPSRFEGLPLAAIEAACAGRPLLTSDIPPFADFAETAITCAVGDVESAAAALARLVDEHPRRLADAIRLRDAYASRFDISTTAQQYSALYASLVGTASSTPVRH